MECGIYILETSGPEFRVKKLNNISALYKDNKGERTDDLSIIKKNARALFCRSYITHSLEEAQRECNRKQISLAERKQWAKETVHIKLPCYFGE